MKLKNFYKLDQNKQPIPASNVRRKSKPPGRWKELDNLCCTPLSIDCTCGPRFFIQVDPRGNPIDHTAIKRTSRPHPEPGIHYKELQWKSPCCIFPDVLPNVTTDFTDGPGQITMSITVCSVEYTNTFSVHYNGNAQSGADLVFAALVSYLNTDPTFSTMGFWKYIDGGLVLTEPSPAFKDCNVDITLPIALEGSEFIYDGCIGGSTVNFIETFDVDDNIIQHIDLDISSGSEHVIHALTTPELVKKVVIDWSIGSSTDTSVNVCITGEGYCFNPGTFSGNPISNAEFEPTPFPADVDLTFAITCGDPCACEE